MKRQATFFAIAHAGICFILALYGAAPAESQTTESKSQAPQLTASVDASTIVSPLPVRTLSLAECFSRADLNNKDIAVARKNLAIAKAGIQIASAIPNPLAQVQLGFGPSFTELFTGQTQQVFFTEQLQTAGKRTKKIDTARAFYQLTELQFDALRFDVHNRVRSAYAELVAAEAYAALVEAQREVSLKLATIAKRRFDAGKAPKSEVLQADLSVLQFDTQRNQAQGRLQQASAALSLVIGEKPEHIEVIDVNDNGLFKLSSEKTDIVPSPMIPLLLLAELQSMAFNHRPDLQVAQQQVFVNERALALARAQRVPNLFVGSGFTFSTFARHQPVGLVPQPNWLGQGAFINVSAENPIFYQHQGEVDQALANLRNSERQVDLLKTQIACGTVIAYNAVKISRSNIFLFQKDLLPLSSRVAKLARRGYEVGATDLATAIVAQQQYQQTLANYFDAVVAYQNAWTNMEKAVGVPLRY
jgi:cobalt-zinc-cadmium efflux system outer membrane protein